MGSIPAEGSTSIARHLDPARALNVQRLLADAASADGFAGLSDQLAADLDDVVAGVAGDSLVVVRDDGTGRLTGIAVASRREGDWTMQTVTGPRDRAGPTSRRLVHAALGAIAAAGGGRVDWWVYAPTSVDDDLAADIGLGADRDLLQMRRNLPAERRADVVTRGFRPGHDEEAWLSVNNRAFAGHHEQHGWTVDTLHQRMRQPWFDADDLRLHERQRRLAAFCWTKRHDATLYEIYVIAVDPDFQGLGLGTQLTLAGLDHMVTRGAAAALLYVAAENTAAVTMYEGLGFTVRRVDRAYVGEVAGDDPSGFVTV
jgi:mycothiol synthase